MQEERKVKDYKQIETDIEIKRNKLRSIKHLSNSEELLLIFKRKIVFYNWETGNREEFGGMERLDLKIGLALDLSQMIYSGEYDEEELMKFHHLKSRQITRTLKYRELELKEKNPDRGSMKSGPYFKINDDKQLVQFCLVDLEETDWSKVFKISKIFDDKMTIEISTQRRIYDFKKEYDCFGKSGKTSVVQSMNLLNLKRFKFYLSRELTKVRNLQFFTGEKHLLVQNPDFLSALNLQSDKWIKFKFLEKRGLSKVVSYKDQYFILMYEAQLIFAGTAPPFEVTRKVHFDAAFGHLLTYLPRSDQLLAVMRENQSNLVVHLKHCSELLGNRSEADHEGHIGGHQASDAAQAEGHPDTN